MHLLIVGPSITKTKGGMATVIDAQLKCGIGSSQFTREHVVSHVEANYLVKFWYVLRSIFMILFGKKYDIAHIHMASNASFYRKSLLMLLVKWKAVPAVLHIHGSDFDEFYLKANKLTKRYFQYIFLKADKVIVLSEYWFTFFKDKFPQASVQVIYNGVDVEIANRNEAAEGNPDHFLFLGRLGKRKGIYDLIAALDVIVNNRNIRSVKFFLAGDGEVSEVSKLITRLNLKDHAVMLGWLNDSGKRKYMQQVATVVLPSYSEGLPMALIEAMANGKVIISTRVGGIPELVEEEKNGFLIEPGDIDGLVEKIVYVLQNKHLANTISHNNRSKIISKYNLAENNRKLFEIYKALINQ